jgi:hypothetical protein
MAVIIEGYSVLVRNATLAEKYPGGTQGYEQDCPNVTFCSDSHLSRVGFMAAGDADVFVARLAARGLTPFRRREAEDVALASQFEGLLRPCTWLTLGEYRGVTIAWLAGEPAGDLHTPPGWTFDRPLRHMSAEEAARRLEFVRSDQHVDVYRDRESGQEYYVGRTANEGQADRSRHDALYERACQLIDGLLVYTDKPEAPIDREARQRLVEAIPLFEEVVQINLGNWAAMWLLGKIYQRLGDNEKGLPWFERSHRVKPDQPDVAREAAIAAMEVGRPDEALVYCRRALEAQPDDPGLQSNLALALLFSGDPAEARTVANDALRKDPGDEIIVRIVGFIEEVLDGRRPCPRHARDLQNDAV